MAKEIQTQIVTIVKPNTGPVFNVPKSYDERFTSLEVFLVPFGLDTGDVIPWGWHNTGSQIIVTSNFYEGDTIIVRCLPKLETLFTKSARQALTSAQVNTLYEHALIVASSANDKVLNEYGITVTGEINPATIATKTEVEVVDDRVTATNVVTAELDDRLDILEAGGVSDVAVASKAHAQGGTNDLNYMTALKTRQAETYHDLKAVRMELVGQDVELISDVAGILVYRLPKMLDGMKVLDIEAQTQANASAGALVVTVKQGLTQIATASLPQGTLYVSKDDASTGVQDVTLIKGQDITIDVTNAGRTVTGLSVTLTVGWDESRYEVV